MRIDQLYKRTQTFAITKKHKKCKDRKHLKSGLGGYVKKYISSRIMKN